MIAWNIHVYYCVKFNLKTFSADVSLQHWMGGHKKETYNVDIRGVIQQREEIKEMGSGLMEKPSYIYYFIGYTVKCS